MNNNAVFILLVVSLVKLIYGVKCEKEERDTQHNVRQILSDSCHDSSSQT